MITPRSAWRQDQDALVLRLTASEKRAKLMRLGQPWIMSEGRLGPNTNLLIIRTYCQVGPEGAPAVISTHHCGLGFTSHGNYEDSYACDPYGGYDAYYSRDHVQAFSNIGFGGGRYDNYFHLGHGIFLFDNVGRRLPMREQYCRYWSERRHN